MTHVYFISHPEVILDRQIPVPEWDLSPQGRARLAILVQHPWMTTIDALFSSTEQKAKTTAAAIAHMHNLTVHYAPGLGEMDRTSTGMLEPDDFDQVVAAFFANPHTSILGWERAIDAQQRIVTTVNQLLDQTAPTSPVAIVSHGGVGTLLLSYLKGTPITRTDDQPGQGHYFVFRKSTHTLIHGWHPIDAPPIVCVPPLE
jgi:broad specificity phosphatase PhoE